MKKIQFTFLLLVSLAPWLMGRVPAWSNLDVRMDHLETRLAHIEEEARQFRALRSAVVGRVQKHREQAAERDQNYRDCEAQKEVNPDRAFRFTGCLRYLSPTITIRSGGWERMILADELTAWFLPVKGVDREQRRKK